jgi:hypothetical protein
MVEWPRSFATSSNGTRALHEPGGERVPQIVDPEVRNLGSRARRLKPVLHEPNALPVPVSEDPV